VHIHTVLYTIQCTATQLSTRYSAPPSLSLEEQDLPCGRLASNSSLPDLLPPGRAGLAVMEKKVTALSDTIYRPSMKLLLQSVKE
jgi:hypothetical protein